MRHRNSFSGVLQKYYHTWYSSGVLHFEEAPLIYQQILSNDGFSGELSERCPMFLCRFV